MRLVQWIALMVFFFPIEAITTDQQEGVFNEEEYADFEKRGYFQSLFQMTSEEIESIRNKLKANSSKQKELETKIVDCTNPKGTAGQCLYECINNPQKSKICHTEKEGVICQRRVCRKQAGWSNSTRMPASNSNQCQTQPHVSPCKD